ERQDRDQRDRGTHPPSVPRNPSPHAPADLALQRLDDDVVCLALERPLQQPSQIPAMLWIPRGPAQRLALEPAEVERRLAVLPHESTIAVDVSRIDAGIERVEIADGRRQIAVPLELTGKHPQARDRVRLGTVCALQRLPAIELDR